MSFKVGFSMGLRGLAIGIAALSSACTTVMPIETASTARSVTSIDALVLPAPGGPTVMGVVEQRYSNGLEQEIALATDPTTFGQNMFRVRLIGAGTGGAVRQTALLDVPPSRVNLDREVREILPGIPMERSAYFAQNSYGPFGYMLGHTGSTSCIFAWQRIGAPTSAPAFGARRGAMDLRLRYCGSGVSDEQLLDLMYGFTIVGLATGVAWNPYPAPIPVDPRIGFSGTMVRPAAAEQAPAIAAVQRQAAAPATQPTAVRADAAPAPPLATVAVEPAGMPPPPLASVAGVVVPPPPGALQQVAPTALAPDAVAPAAVTAIPQPAAGGAAPLAPVVLPAAVAAPSGPVVPPPPVMSAMPDARLAPPPTVAGAPAGPVVPPPPSAATAPGTPAAPPCDTLEGSASGACESPNGENSTTGRLAPLTKG